MTFEVSIEVTECPANRQDWKKDIKIYPVGLTEALIIHLDMICECDCEQSKYEVGLCNQRNVCAVVYMDLPKQKS